MPGTHTIRRPERSAATVAVGDRLRCRGERRRLQPGGHRRVDEPGADDQHRARRCRRASRRGPGRSRRGRPSSSRRRSSPCGPARRPRSTGRRAVRAPGSRKRAAVAMPTLTAPVKFTCTSAAAAAGSPSRSACSPSCPKATMTTSRSPCRSARSSISCRWRRRCRRRRTSRRRPSRRGRRSSPRPRRRTRPARPASTTVRVAGLSSARDDRQPDVARAAEQHDRLRLTQCVLHDAVTPARSCRSWSVSRRRRLWSLGPAVVGVDPVADRLPLGEAWVAAPDRFRCGAASLAR